MNPDGRARLLDFRQRVSQGRLVKFWTRAEELPGLVVLFSALPTSGEKTWSVKLSWRDLFATIGPSLLDHPNDSVVRTRLRDFLFARVWKPCPAGSMGNR